LIENEGLMLRLMPNLLRLEEKSGVAKRIKYQGLLFSGAQVIDLPVETHVCEIAAVTNDVYDFTDGCGLMSLKLAKFLHPKIHGLGITKKGRGTATVPGVFHIRYAGRIQRLDNNIDNSSSGNEANICKGVLLVDYRNDDTYEMCFRKSMLKERVSDDCANVLGKKIGIIGWSKESPGRLSQQLICLLTASVPHFVLEEIQQNQLGAVEKAIHDPLSAAWLAGLEPKTGPWYAFQGLLLGAGREHQSKRLSSSADSQDVEASDMTAPTSIPSDYFVCTKGRSHPRHLSDNLTKVQVPLASCRTLFGAAFPETLSCFGVNGFGIGEGECIVMLEDGLLEDKVSFSWHILTWP
jgi:hypothetical protein